MSTSPLENVKSALRRLNLSEPEQQVYLALLRDGQATARLLAARTGITRPSVYDQIKSLQAVGLVIELEIENKTHFAATDVKHLGALLDDQIDRLEQSRNFLTDALPALRESLAAVDPKLRFFESEDGLKQLLKDVMWHSHTTLQMVWPETLSANYDEMFLQWFDTRRTTRKLAVEMLYSSNPPYFTKQPTDKRRRLPKRNIPNMGYLIYDQKVAFISSQAEAFGFIVESNEFAALQRLQFKMLWQAAK